MDRSYGDASSQGRIDPGTHGDSSSKGYITVQGIRRPRTLFRGHIIRGHIDIALNTTIEFEVDNGDQTIQSLL